MVHKNWWKLQLRCGLGNLGLYLTLFEVLFYVDLPQCDFKQLSPPALASSCYEWFVTECVAEDLVGVEAVFFRPSSGNN